MGLFVRVLGIVCALSAGCSDGRQTCDPTPRCTPEGQVVACRGGVYYFSSCGPQTTCFAGACAPITCKPSFFFCDGAVADDCDATGTQHERTDCAQMGGACVVGATSAGCQSFACTPLQTYCSPDGTEVRKCAGDGNSYGVVQICADPQQRGNRCVGSACRDRCELVEAQDRSTLGCRFLGSAFDAPLIRVANPQLDLPATVSVSQVNGTPSAITVAPGETADLPIGATAQRTTSQSSRAIFVTSSVPVYVWDLGAPHALHPEHALSSVYRAAIDHVLRGHDVLSVTASVDGTQVTVTPTGAIIAGGPIATTPAGTPIVRTLIRGDVLTLASNDLLAGTHVTADAPVSVEIANDSEAATMPGVETLGRDYVSMAEMVIARDATVVTTEIQGTFSLAAGEWASLGGMQRIHATAPILVVTPTLTPSVEQMLTTSFAAGNSVTALAPAPTTLTPTVDVSPAASGTFAVQGFNPSKMQPYSAPTPFWLWMQGAPLQAWPGPYGLAILP